ncbi:MAG: tRNA (adenosine(37)-N6)-dimethylallyltransferase MiaA [Erythrobacter sp.]|nr:tRNA (adenosine(37)-N6)-dimethylallyltransferase MiaA [Erythrobacter sp.]
MGNVATPKCDDRKPPLALIAGPTASGKSEMAVQLALALRKRGREGARNGVVINADSAQVYADLRVLSARPSTEEMRGVEHRLFGAWDGGFACSAADWANAARAEIGRVHEAGGVPILCGGTGLYLQTLIDGIAPIPEIDPAIRDAVRAMPMEAAYAALAREDPERHTALDPSDRQRISRALEVVRSTGRTIGEWQETREGGIGGQVDLHAVVLLPNREWLYARCERRFEAMLEHGAVAEVEALLARGLSPDLPVMRAIGVREIAGFLKGELERDEMIVAGAQATRNYAKRQYTWFRNQSPPDWLRIEDHNYDIESVFASLLQL